MQKLEQLEYQEQAIKSVVDIFKGTPRNTFDNSVIEEVRSNWMSLSAKELKNNIEIIQKNNQISGHLATLDQDACIEMETGTGKTLVYVQTIFELFRTYGFSKFIILVPSVAIREGVLSTLQTFQAQLENKYNIKPHYFAYDSNQINKVREFAESQHLQVMIMTLQSFSSNDNILNQTQREDLLISEKSFLKTIALTRPIIVMDEPQEGMDTQNSISRIASLNPLFKLRYSATHREMKNLIYRLTPREAYKQNLVKKIAVLSVTEKHDEGSFKLELEKIYTGKTGGGVQATFRAYHQNKPGSQKYTTDFSLKTTKKLSWGEDLARVTSNNSYQGYIIEEISGGGVLGDQSYVKFRNGQTLYEGQKTTDYTTIFRLQLYYLIREHFKKKKKLAERDIKCLSLIFIDKVDSYVVNDGLIKVLFEDNFRKAYQDEYGLPCSDKQLQKCQGFYFAKTTKGDYTDNERSMVGNKDLYDLILRDKEKLLSLENPVEFIFSHSALGVGWDNPNVFNIATLNQSHSEISKRQRLGRGLRICIDQSGQRVYDNVETPDDKLINELTVVPNESYKSFAADYQREVGDPNIKLKHKPQGRDKYKTLVRNDDLYNQPSFDEFWLKISQKTEYSASFDEEDLIKKAINSLKTILLNAPHIDVDKVLLDYDPNLFDEPEEVRARYKGFVQHKLNPVFAPLDIVYEISQRTALTRHTVVRIISKLDNKSQILKNPPAFIQQAVEKLKNLLTHEGVRGQSLKYRAIDEYYDKSKFQQKVNTSVSDDKLEATKQKGIYNLIVCDSDVERQFIKKVVEAGEIELFLKFPPFYKIKTPAGSYNPDFGIVLLKSDWCSHNTLFFVVETKATNNIEDQHSLTQSERHKMQYAHKHFEALGFDVKYIAPVDSYEKFKDQAREYVGLE